jgi:hypothetical protein
MAVCTGLMVVAVLATAVLLTPDWGAVLTGLTVPRIPANGASLTLGVLGGVGGTVTLLSYGYWIAERGRTGAEGVRACRTDLAAGYALTALFGVAMIVIGSRVSFRQGPAAALELAGQLELALGPAGRWIFLAGFWGAVFSSLLGVWQSIPYLFADFVTLPGRLAAPDTTPVDLKATRTYRACLIAITVVPLAQLALTVQRAQLLYAVIGAFFMPLLACTLLILNTRRGWIGERWRNGWATNLALAVTLLLFLYVGAGEIADALGSFRSS